MFCRIHLPAKPTLLFLLLIVSLSLTVNQAAAKEKAPDFTLTDVDGTPFTLSECSAKVVLIDFFATWCSPCRAAIPTFRELYAEYQRSQLEIVSISPEETDALEIFARDPQTNMTWIVVSDPTGSVSNSYLGGDTRIPHMFLIDFDGYIAHDHLGWGGEQDASELRSKINSIISGDYNSDTDQPGDNDSSADQPGWPLATITIIIGVIIFLSIVGLIAAGNLLGWSSPQKKRSKGRTKSIRIRLGYQH